VAETYGARARVGEIRNSYKILVERNRLGDLDINGGIILNLIVKK
jgi:hypothetical protein